MIYLLEYDIVWSGFFIMFKEDVILYMDKES
jgi:hypothetical protein